jgi:MoaA/NifB/PqqE/SkfB family radical SAM enzyme
MMRLASLISDIRRNRKQIPNMPRLLTYLVTFRCNMRCIMCDSWRKNDSNELTVAEIRSIFRQLPKLDLVRLSGGEPFLRRDLLDIANAAQSLLNPIGLHITTNGVLTDRIVDFCEQRHKDTRLYLLVSLDGIGETHNAIRGRSNVWERAVHTIETLAPRQKQLRLHLGVNQTIVSEDSLKEYGRLKIFLKPLGLQNSVVFAYNESATYHIDDQTTIRQVAGGQFKPFGRFDAGRLGSFFANVHNDLTEYPSAVRLAKRYYLKGIKNRLLHQIGFPNPNCVALSSHLRMMPDGSLPTCQFNSTRIGNLRNRDFASIWFGDTVAKQRRWVHRCPGCWAECEILPNAIYTGDLGGLIFNRDYWQVLFPNAKGEAEYES